VSHVQRAALLLDERDFARESEHVEILIPELRARKTLPALERERARPHGARAPGTATSAIVGVDPQLGPLRDNGGPTATRGLPSTSPAVDASPVGCPATDQRGVARPQDGNGDGRSICDIGAYERLP
jgi:hypothetical protein